MYFFPRPGKKDRKKKKKMLLFFFALSSSILATKSVAYAAAAAAADLQSARHVLAFMPNYGLAVERRQVIECASVEPGPLFCERSCGPLFTSCVTAESCYVPSLGQTCCENAGKYKSLPSRFPSFSFGERRLSFSQNIYIRLYFLELTF